MTQALRSDSQAVPLRVDVVQWGTDSCVMLEGRLDETFEETLNAAFERLIEKKRTRVVVDLRKLAFLNSRGVSTFIAALDAFRELGGDLKLAGATPQARFVLARLGVDRILQQFDTPKQAFDAFEVPIQDFLSRGGLDVFVTSLRGRVFHASDCPKLKRLKRVKIHANKKAARDAGLSPCSRCCGV